MSDADWESNLSAVGTMRAWERILLMKAVRCPDLCRDSGHFETSCGRLPCTFGIVNYFYAFNCHYHTVCCCDSVPQFRLERALKIVAPQLLGHVYIAFSFCQERACNTMVSWALARSATRRQWARRPAPRSRAHTGVRTATLPWRGVRGADTEVPPPVAQRRQPSSVAQHLRTAQSPRRAAHLRTVDGVADTTHGRAGGIDRSATGRLFSHRKMASATAYASPQQMLAHTRDHSWVIVRASNPGSRCAQSPRATRSGGGGLRVRCRLGSVTPVAGQSVSATKRDSIFASSRRFEH